MAQLLKPEMLNFKQTEIGQSGTSENLLQPGGFIKIQPVAIEKSGVELQPITPKMNKKN